MHDGAIKIRLAAPPVDGAANAALIEFVAERLGLAKSRVRLVSSSTMPATLESDPSKGTHITDLTRMLKALWLS